MAVKTFTFVGKQRDGLTWNTTRRDNAPGRAKQRAFTRKPHDGLMWNSTQLGSALEGPKTH